MVTLIGRHANKLQIAQNRNLETMLSDKTRQRQGEFDVVVEASGSAAGFDQALDLLRARGVLVLKSTFHGGAEVDAARIVVNEISVVGSRCGRFAPALELLASPGIDVESMISEEFKLAEGVRAHGSGGGFGDHENPFAAMTSRRRNFVYTSSTICPLDRTPGEAARENQSG